MENDKIFDFVDGLWFDPVLSPLELKTMQFLREFIAENGYSPTYREISKGIKKKKFHPSEINRIVYQLKNKNLIDIKKAKNCSIRLIHGDPRYESRP